MKEKYTSLDKIILSVVIWLSALYVHAPIEELRYIKK